VKFRSPVTRVILIGVFIILIIVCETGAYLATTPRATEHFFQFYLLGRNGNMTDYYPQGDPNLRVGSNVEWTVGVQNYMGSVQLVEIRVKLANETISPPDDVNYAPSSARELMSFNQFLLDNGTWQFPFIWSITNASTISGSTRILTIRINNQTYQTSDWSANNGYNFRLIFELWTWQAESNAFVFDFGSNGGHRTAWLEVWFNATNPTPLPPPPPQE
jgi:uncharacterized membrane protein